jgi:hypothetical protein
MDATLSGDLLSQNYSTVQSQAQPLPNTAAAAATVTPTQKLSFLSGQTQVANITPPNPAAYCEITLCFTHAAPGAFLTNGATYPIKTAYQPIQNRPIDLCWDPSSKYWWVKAVV